MFVELAVTTGILGLAPMVIMFGFLSARFVKLLLRAPHDADATSYSFETIDALLIGTVVMVSELTTAGAAYYSWQMIGLVVLALGVYSIAPQQSSAHKAEDVSPEATVMQPSVIAHHDTPILFPEREPFKI
jgi:hypothetical protein